jgi:hypothetical protein
MKRLFLSINIFLLVNYALAVDASHQAVVEKNLTAEEMAQWIATDGMEDSEESYYMHLIDWLSHIPKADREAAFMKVILNIRLEAIEPSYREKVQLFAQQIGTVASNFIQTGLAHIPAEASRDDKRYRKLSDRITQDLWFDSETKKQNGFKSRKHVRFWRGYKLIFEICQYRNGQLSVLLWPSDPIRGVVLGHPWGLRCSDGEVIKEFGPAAHTGYTFEKLDSIMYRYKLKNNGLRFQYDWALPGDN